MRGSGLVSAAFLVFFALASFFSSSLIAAREIFGARETRFIRPVFSTEASILTFFSGFSVLSDVLFSALFSALFLSPSAIFSLSFSDFSAFFGLAVLPVFSALSDLADISDLSDLPDSPDFSDFSDFSELSELSESAALSAAKASYVSVCASAKISSASFSAALLTADLTFFSTSFSTSLSMFFFSAFLISFSTVFSAAFSAAVSAILIILSFLLFSLLTSREARVSSALRFCAFFLFSVELRDSRLSAMSPPPNIKSTRCDLPIANKGKTTDYYDVCIAAPICAQLCINV